MIGDSNLSGKFNAMVRQLWGDILGFVSYLGDLTITSDDPETLIDRVWRTLSIARNHSALFKPRNITLLARAGNN